MGRQICGLLLGSPNQTCSVTPAEAGVQRLGSRFRGNDDRWADGETRMTWVTRICVLLVETLCLAGFSSDGQSGTVPQSGINVTDSDLRASPPAANWLSYNGDYSGRRYSSLDQINVANVGRLRAQWVFHSDNSQTLEVTPVVVNGVMYVTSGNDGFALDARTGRTLWQRKRSLTRGLIEDASAHHNRGMAVWHDRVYMETDDAHLLAMDARSGGLIWDVAFGNIRENPANGATSAPLVVNGKVIVAPSGGDAGVRGHIDAFDAFTGKLVWRFWTIPGPGEPGYLSWPKGGYQHGGGTAWMPGTYDSEANTLYWVTGNPGPDFEGLARPGDDLYTDCVLALDPDTGKLKWYFQFTPHDLFDYDAVETPAIVNGTFQGKPRKLLIQADRNGFLYILDRANGKFLAATQFLEKLTWAKGVDSNGRPILTGLIPTARGAEICPGLEGATNWYAPSYNPATGFFYFLALERCNIYYAHPEPFEKGKSYYNTGTVRVPGQKGEKVLLAYKVNDGTLAWKYPQIGGADSWAGTMTTAGGLVFFGDDAGMLEAVDAGSGAPLWHFNTGQQIHASPMSYAVGGVEYVAIAAGSDIFTFALGD
jgi:alcohol dehydrogenase (cytochrome c)